MKSSYDEKYIPMAESIIKLGGTDADIADAFQVCEKTINNWKRKHEEFRTAIKKAKEAHDVATVGRKLLDICMGYEHEEEKVFMHRGKPVKVSTIKHYPPNVAALKFYLINRDPGSWKNIPESPGGSEELMKAFQTIARTFAGETPETETDK